jgi:hypothetical protein
MRGETGTKAHVLAWSGGKKYQIQCPYFRVGVRNGNDLDSHEENGLRLSVSFDLEQKIMVFDWRRY